MRRFSLTRILALKHRTVWGSAGMLSVDRDYGPVQSHGCVPSPRLSKTVRATGDCRDKEREREIGETVLLPCTPSLYTLLCEITSHEIMK
uniref:Putative secreted protein n=1 Tax=Anopheles marajoara TaxID=58244 RepID=A0A2M4CB32_9DIPT